jgi:hypothetical protein
MRRVFAIMIVIGFLTPAEAAPAPEITTFGSTEAGLKWIKEYRAKPDPKSVPALIRMLSERGSFKEPEASGLYVGFLAGVLGSNPRSAKFLINQTLPFPYEDQWLLIRAVAYSGLPHWRDLLKDLAVRLPDRRLLVEHYLNGKLPTMDKVRLEPERPKSFDKVRRIFKRETYFGPKKEPVRDVTFATNPELIDTQWGLYFANGKDPPLERIMALLPWSTERDNLEKLTIGGMAKFTLTANAARDATLLRAMKRLTLRQSNAVQPLVDEVIEAAETADIGRIRKEALAGVEELRRKGPGSKRDIAWWGKVGEVSLSLGCLGAAVTGQVEFGIPCVVGGALSTAALRYFASPE